MLNWKNVLNFVSNGNPDPDRRVSKTEAEWREILTPEQFQVARLKGTERAFSSGMCELHEPGKYGCLCCNTPLFDSTEKFDSGTGWPSFTQPITDNAIAHHNDGSYGMTRIEVTCNTCDAHLGHVFPDGPEPSGLRYCINAISLTKFESDSKPAPKTKLATFGGGCFWCTEALFQQLRGVVSVTSGYAGGQSANPKYHEVCSGATGHAEVIQVEYNPGEISYADLLKVHFGTHNPTTLNQQGADRGTQYRSIVFYQNDEELEQASAIKDEVAALVENPVVTELAPFETFYPAEDNHQDYYRLNPQGGYCAAVIQPKLKKFRDLFGNLLKADS
ncbi:MAG: bifunctional methionine sulfoxide reductase B/A protein [Verrucomicrobia bacterium]|nr:bifunctional methionine sulfoxide reductase B/A protein [Verrucomicrobiota bacterium]MDA1065239.1 bifunctional methionine sulfoxide reductase B/A protein [Verrucomicrobiota bacterium]